MSIDEAEKIKTVVENKDYIVQLVNTVVKTLVGAFENLKIEDVNMFQLGYNKAIDDLNLIHGKLIVRRIHGGHKMSGKQTNADRIRNMSDEELAEYLCKVKSDYQWMEHEFPSEEEHSEWEEWLKSESEE